MIMNKMIERISYYVNDGALGEDASCQTKDGVIVAWGDSRKPAPTDEDLSSITEATLIEREKERQTINVMNSILGKAMVEEFLSILANGEAVPDTAVVMDNVKSRVKSKL
jgi:hypothetical protein